MKPTLLTYVFQEMLEIQLHTITSCNFSFVQHKLAKNLLLLLQRHLCKSHETLLSSRVTVPAALVVPLRFKAANAIMFVSKTHQVIGNIKSGTSSLF